MISNQPIVTAFAYLNAAVQEGLPSGATLSRVQDLSSGDREAGRRFVRDLGTVVGRLDELRQAIQQQVKSLDSQPRVRRRLTHLRWRRIGSGPVTAHLSAQSADAGSGSISPSFCSSFLARRMASSGLDIFPSQVCTPTDLKLA